MRRSECKLGSLEDDDGVVIATGMSVGVGWKDMVVGSDGAQGLIKR